MSGIQGFHVLHMRCIPKRHHQPCQIIACSCSVVLGTRPKHASQEVSASALPNGMLIFLFTCVSVCMHAAIYTGACRGLNTGLRPTTAGVTNDGEPSYSRTVNNTGLSEEQCEVLTVKPYPESGDQPSTAPKGLDHLCLCEPPRQRSTYS